MTEEVKSFDELSELEKENIEDEYQKEEKEKKLREFYNKKTGIVEKQLLCG